MLRILLLTTVTSLSLIGAVPLRRHQEEQSPFSITVNTDGSYSIQVNNVTWLTSAPTFFRAEGKLYTTADGSLNLTSTVATSGQDKLGQWQSTCFNYLAWHENVEGDRIKACIKTYTTPNSSFIIFQQIYQTEVSSTSSGDINGVISGFPSFQLPDSGPSLGYFQWAGDMFGGTFMQHGQWSKSKLYLSGGIAAGPILIFDTKDNVLVTSPFNQFMAAAVTRDSQTGAVNWGIMGGVEQVPLNFEQQFIIYYGGQGINQAMSSWGELMTHYYEKERRYRETDFTLNYLGYWTDGGAYYYYHTEPNKNYEQTILDVHNYTSSAGIPYRYVQYDSYFYAKGPHNGVTTWEPQPSLFPNGFQFIYDKTGWPAGAHNRYWSSKTPYARQNGGNFYFIVEKEKSIPVDESFWNYLFDNARKWGLTLYEQDWLNVEFSGLNATLTNTQVGRTWLMQMGRAAEKNGLTIQYCMANPRHGMQALEIPVVTQARASGDYRAGGDQWRIGLSSILVDAMGVAPYKDTFWTTKDQPGNTYNLTEPYGLLQALVATLSTGPVGPSDMIGKTNVSLLMQCCNADGLILKPSKPAMAIDAQVQQSALPSSDGPTGEIWTTYSKVGPFVFGIIMAVEQTKNYDLTSKAAGFNFFLPQVVFPAELNFNRSLRYPTKVEQFGVDTPLTLRTNCTKGNVCLYYTSPVFTMESETILIYGEMGKFVPMSPQRVTDISVEQNDIRVTVVGAVAEDVYFKFLRTEGGMGEPAVVLCSLGGSGTAVISLMRRTCTEP